MGQSRWPHDVPLREPHPIVFVTEQRGYVVCLSNPNDTSGIYETNDGGKSWTLLKNPNGSDVSLMFLGTQDGVAFGPTHYWATTNGGQSWFRVHLKALWRPWLPASDPAVWLPASDRTVAGLYLADLAHLPMARTLNDMVRTLTDLPYSINGQFAQIGFAGSRVAWFSNKSLAGVFFTTDGGAKWSNMHGITGVDFVNREDGWAQSSGGSLLRTTNGGKTWTYASNPTP